MTLLDAAPAAQTTGGAGSGAMNIIMIVALIVIFYFFMIRPQQKRQKEIKKFRAGIAVGDNIVTAGGIHGKIKNINDATFDVEIAPSVRITVDKGSVYPAASQPDPNAMKKD